MSAPHYGRDGLMAIAAFRYCLGRQSYIVGDCCEWLTEQWSSLPGNVRRVIERDLREAIQSDDDARKRGEQYKPLGMDMDRAGWLAVLAAIETHAALRTQAGTTNDATGAEVTIDDGDALRLAVERGYIINIDKVVGRVTAGVWSDGGESASEPLGADPYAATRRAIVRAAALGGA